MDAEKCECNDEDNFGYALCCGTGQTYGCCCVPGCCDKCQCHREEYAEWNEED